MSADAVRIVSPAKINLFLEVLRRRPDGYHDVVTLLQAVDLCDRIVVRGVPRGICIVSRADYLPLDCSNLAWKAAGLFLRESGIKSGVRIHLEKKIPMAAGLGGGSSNAAATLLALDKLFGTRLGLEKLSDMASELGSDVAFFLRGVPCVGLGRGNEITPLAASFGFWVVLAGPVGISQKDKTAQVYRGLKIGLTNRQKKTRLNLNALETKDLKELSRNLFNRLESVVLDRMPVSRRLKEFMCLEGALGALVSGAGPSVFGIVPNKAAGNVLSAKIQRHFGAQVWVVLAKTLARTPPARFTRWCNW